jgi:tripartite-type tricarboxylate transporter receptor subunit TctC
MSEKIGVKQQNIKREGVMAITRRHVLAGAAALAASNAFAQEGNWPQRPIRIIIPTSPGGSPDITSRLLGDKITPRIGQSFIVESQTTGGGTAGLQMVAKSPPDGYTLAMLTGGFATQAAVLKNLQYQPLKDFAFITTVVRYPMVYSVRPDSPIKSFKDMIERAKANPGKVSYGIVGAGNVYHLLGKWIDNAAGVEMNAVPYRGTALALQDVLGGRIDVLSDAATSSIPRVLSGQLRALAVSSAEPYPLLPGVPTMAEAVPGIKVESWLGMAAPAATPKPILDRLNSEFRRALDLPEVKKWAAESGVVPAPSTPEQFRARVESDVRQWTEIVVRNNITVQ